MRQGLSVEPRVVSNFQSSCFILTGLQACTSRPIRSRDLGQCLGSADGLWIMKSFLSVGLTQIALNVYPAWYSGKRSPSFKVAGPHTKSCLLMGVWEIRHLLEGPSADMRQEVTSQDPTPERASSHNRIITKHCSLVTHRCSLSLCAKWFERISSYVESGTTGREAVRLRQAAYPVFCGSHGGVSP